MTILVPIVLFGWIPIVLLLFALMKPQRAFLTAYLGAWLFLPMARYPLWGLPDYDKVTASNFGVMLATLIFQPRLLAAFRFRWYDLPMIVWCLCPIGTGLSNNDSFYDTVSVIVFNTMLLGFPYFLARVYFTDWSGLRLLAVGLLIAGAIYAPLCIWEIRMSPNLHSSLYGYHQHSFIQSKRGSLWRPTVFMQHGLAVAVFMASAALSGLWLWWSGIAPRIMGVPVKWVVSFLAATVVFSQSHLATILMFVGAGALLSLKTSIGRGFLALLLLASPTYMLARTVGGWDGTLLLDISEAVSGSERTGSLRVRIESENLLSEHALKQPVFGWGGFGRYLVPDAVPDGMWLIALGKHGLVGLVGFTSILLLQPALMLRWPKQLWRQPALAPCVLLGLLLILHMIDSLMNAMVNPLYMILAAALGPAVASIAHRASRPVPAPNALPPSPKAGSRRRPRTGDTMAGSLASAKIVDPPRAVKSRSVLSVDSPRNGTTE